MEKFISQEVDAFEPRGHSRGSMYLVAKQKVHIHKLSIFTLGIDRPENVPLDDFIRYAKMLLNVYYRIGISSPSNQYAIMKDRKNKTDIEKYLKTHKAKVEIFKDEDAPVSRAIIEIENIELLPGEFLEILSDADFTHWWFRNRPKKFHKIFEFFVEDTLEPRSTTAVFARCLPFSVIEYDFVKKNNA